MSTLTTYDAMFNRFFGLPSFSLETASYNDEITQEADGSYKLTVEVPGYNRDHVTLSTKETQLVVTLQQPNKEKKSLTYRLGSKIDQTKIAATCKDGLLTITCPVKQSEQSRAIPVS